MPRLAEELVVARAAGQHVVAGAAEQLGGGQRAVGFVERDRVVAALAEHLDQRGVGDSRRAAVDGDGAAVDENISGCVAADRDGVVDVVAEHREQAGARGKAGLDSHGRSPFEGLAAAQMRVGREQGRMGCVSAYQNAQRQIG